MILTTSIAVLGALAGPELNSPAEAGNIGAYESNSRDELKKTLRHYRSSDLWQTVYWAHTFTDQKSIVIEHYDPATEETRTFSYSAAFKIEHVAAQKSDLNAKKEYFIVAGVTDIGDSVIERWVHKPKKYQMPGAPLAYQLDRSVVYSGTSLGTIDSIQVEPFGKFVVVAHSDPNPHLSQISLSVGHAITPLLDPVYETLLSSGVVAIKRAQHETEGLLWVVYLLTSVHQGSDWALILRDMNGDDVLDDWLSYTYGQMSTEYPSRFSKAPWVDDFRTYWE